MIATLGAGIAQANVKFVWAHGKFELNLLPAVCHRRTSAARKSRIGQIAVGLE